VVGLPVRRAVADSFGLAHAETLTLPAPLRESPGTQSFATTPIMLLQDANDLLFRQSCLLHRPSSP
ncbi:hypothetical protein ACEPPZ_16675, partial [Paracoccus yeei]|uniref:hypothetical protein n=1 Tax=Paracoccus yeei TaxID=147645 RepID=UPI0037CF3C49